MLYLPAFRFEDDIVRLPSCVDDIFDLCVASSGSIELDGTIEQLLSRNPGLLIYCLHQFWLLKNRTADSVPELAGFLETGLFASEAETGAFTPSPVLNAQQQRRVERWSAKPTRKRLLRFLRSVTKLDRSTSNRLVSAILATGFLSGISPQLLAVPKAIAVPNVKSPAFEAEPVCRAVRPSTVSGIWRICGRLQKLQTEFQCELHREKMRAMRQLAYGASHEINNPLANIATRAQSLMADEENPSRRQRLSVVYAQAMRAHDMISDMMLFAHPPALRAETVEPWRLVSAVVMELKLQLDAAGIAVRVHQYPNVPFCELDPTQFAVALQALLQNAIHAIGIQGEIRIQIWRASEREWSMSAADSGRGIDDGIADQIFDPFFSGREAGRGLGFGLSKVWRIVELHGGRIRLDSEHQAGARFVMTLPIHQTMSDKDATSRIDNLRAA